MKSKDEQNVSRVLRIAKLCAASEAKICVAESCTGGGLAYMLTAVAGASSWFDRGFVTYSNQAKQELLNVDSACLEKFGAVSEQTASQMALGALGNSDAQLALSITGVAGPSGGTEAKPVGMVCIGVAAGGAVDAETKIFSGDRMNIRESTIEFSLDKLIFHLSN